MNLALIFLLFILSSCTSNTGKTSLESRIEKLEATAPGVGEVMTHVQLHFSKLYFAADAKNWDLANFEIDEVREDLEAAALLRPEERGVRLGNVIDAFKQTELEGMKSAVQLKDLAAFTRDYDESIMVCNSCHASTGRPYIVITQPTSPPVFNQLWKPSTER